MQSNLIITKADLNFAAGLYLKGHI